jgi:hypothetical protein
LSGTVRVRIAVITTSDRKWSASGGGGCSDDLAEEVTRNDLYESECVAPGAAERLTWVEADVPLPERPEAVTVEGEVSDG